jgi:hypothetical protein
LPQYPDLNPQAQAQNAQAPQMLVAMIGSGGMAMMGTVITDDDIKFHDESWMVLPNGMTYERARQILQAKQEEEENVVAITRKYLYRPDDGAAAAAAVLKERYGITLGKETKLPFGMTKPPVLKTITVGVGETIQAPWDLVEIPVVKGAEIRLMATDDDDWGPVFYVAVETPKKHRKEIDALLDALEQHLKEHSIYRGKAVVGAGRLDFLDTSKFDPTKICFSDHVNEMLENAVFGAIRNADAFVADGIPLRRAILLHGPYGTGKSSIGLKTAQIAEANGWTFLMGKTGSDSVKTVLQTAKLYQRCVVFVEDIDTQATTDDPQKIAQLLEAFDGVTSKGTEIILVMTTNHVDRIHKGLMRPGRLDFMIEIGALDRHGVERLLRAVVKPGQLYPDTDFDLVYKAMEGFEPAFVKATADRAKTWALNRTEGNPDYLLMTDDFVGAAQSLREQLRLLNEAHEGIPEPAIETALRGLLRDELNGLEVAYPDSDKVFDIRVPVDNS